MLINNVKKPYPIATLTCAPIEVYCENKYLRIVNLGNSPGWVASDVANLFEVLLCNIFKEFQQLSLVNWRTQVILESGIEQERLTSFSSFEPIQQPSTPIWVLRDEAFWLLIMLGVGLKNKYNYKERNSLKKWLFASVIPRLIQLGFYEKICGNKETNFSLVTPEFLDEYKQQFLSKIEILEKTNTELRYQLQRQEQNFTNNLEQLQTDLQEVKKQQFEILQLLENRLNVPENEGNFFTNWLRASLITKKSHPVCNKKIFLHSKQ